MRKLLFLFMFFLAGGCSSTRITNFWVVKPIPVNQFKKIMVVALVPDDEVILRFEMEGHIVDDLNENNLQSVSSVSAFGPKSFRNQPEDSVLTQLMNSGADAVITIVLLNKQRERHYVPATVYYTPFGIYHHHFWGYYNTMYTRIYSPGYYQFSTKYFWESNFYDLANKSLLYSVQTESFDPVDRNALAHEYGKLIVSDLIDKFKWARN